MLREQTENIQQQIEQHGQSKVQDLIAKGALAKDGRMLNKEEQSKLQMKEVGRSGPFGVT